MFPLEKLPYSGGGVLKTVHAAYIYSEKLASTQDN
jgi:hypothetical protein